MFQNKKVFVFDNQMLAQIIWFDYTVAEESCPTSYFAEASSINFIRSLKYGLGCWKIACAFRLAEIRIIHSPLFPAHG